MSIQRFLLTVGIFFWLGALCCWLRGRGQWRLSREAMLFLLFGAPFLAAGAFFAASSYPQDVVRVTPAPAEMPSLPHHPPAAAPIAVSPAPASRRGPRDFAELVRINQFAAVAQHPSLGIEGSPFNRRFLAAYRRLQFEEPAYFSVPEWPLRLADEIARQLAQLPPELSGASSPLAQRPAVP